MIYTMINPSGKAGIAMETTRIFTNGRSQAVRIPKQYRFDVDEVYVNKVGDTLMLTPKASLAKAFEQGAAMLTDDFLADGAPEDIPSPRDAL